MTELDIKKFKNKDEAALADFLNLIEPRVRQVITDMLSDRPQSDIDEVVDDVMSLIFSNLDYFFKYDDTEKILTICSKIARNSAIHHQRQLRNIDTSNEIYETQLEKLADERQTDKISNEMRIALDEVISQLPATDQQLIEMYFLSGMRLKEISSILGISTQATSARLSRLLRRLRDAIDPKESRIRR